MDNLLEIIDGCKAGKRRHQEKLYKMFARKMYGVCLYFAKDQATAEDILQEGFIKVFANIGMFENKGSFEGWMRRIMVNTSLERFRRQHHLYAVGEIEDYANDISYDDVINQISAGDLMNIIQDLTHQYRVVFMLYAIEGYSHKEISEKLGITEGTSKSNLSRARKILQDKVNALYYNQTSTMQNVAY